MQRPLPIPESPPLQAQGLPSAWQSQGWHRSSGLALCFHGPKSPGAARPRHGHVLFSEMGSSGERDDLTSWLKHPQMPTRCPQRGTIQNPGLGPPGAATSCLRTPTSVPATATAAEQLGASKQKATGLSHSLAVSPGIHHILQVSRPSPNPLPCTMMTATMAG